LIVPALAVQVTPELKLPVPVTVAEQADEPAYVTVEGVQETTTALIVVNVSVAVPDLLLSYELVAVIVAVAALVGAV
jgi:hypothetical protein